MSIDLSKESNLQLLGKRIDRLFCDWDMNAALIYVSGIPHFDTKLGIHKFEETDCCVQIEVHENAVIFILTSKRALAFIYYGIWRKDMLTCEIIENSTFQVPKVNRFKESLPWAPLGGGIGVAIAEYRKDKAANKKEFSILSTKEGSGAIIRLNLIDDNDLTTRQIIFNLPNKYYYHLIKAVFNKYWTNTLNIKSSN